MDNFVLNSIGYRFYATNVLYIHMCISYLNTAELYIDLYLVEMRNAI